MPNMVWNAEKEKQKLQKTHNFLSAVMPELLSQSQDKKIITDQVPVLQLAVVASDKWKQIYFILSLSGGSVLRLG